MSRDPIGEQGGVNLYGFVGNAGLDGVDHLGRVPFGVLWDIYKSALQSGFWDFIEELERDAPYMSAVGVQAGGGFVPGMGSAIIGVNGMFFPEECEFAGFWYVSGTFHYDEIQDRPLWLQFEGWKDDLMEAGWDLAHTLSIGILAGAGAEAVVAQPIGSFPNHRADSRTEWFYTVMGGGAGISGSVCRLSRNLSHNARCCRLLRTERSFGRRVHTGVWPPRERTTL